MHSINMQRLWSLNPDVDFLNHGSFGATPRCVLEEQRSFVDSLERDPIDYLAPERTLYPKLDSVRRKIAGLVNESPENIVFVRNATDGVNAVMRSLALGHQDEVVITNHGYNACNNAVRFVTDRCDARCRVAEIPFPISNEDEVLSAIQAQLTARTRILVVDHITSPTALVFPIQQIIAMAHERDVRVLVDAAHAPGMLPIDLQAMAPDYYTGNHHKWLCGPKASGFLFAQPRWQTELRPTVISHGANHCDPGKSRFHSEFDWIGTYDPTSILAVPKAIQFLTSIYEGGLTELMQRNRAKALEARRILEDALGLTPPSPEGMLGSMAAVPLPTRLSGERLQSLQRELIDEHRFELPILVGPSGRGILRVSLQAYNDIEQIERLGKVLRGIPDLR